MIKHRKVSGIRFIKAGKHRVSYCKARPGRAVVSYAAPEPFPYVRGLIMGAAIGCIAMALAAPRYPECSPAIDYGYEVAPACVATPGFWERAYSELDGDPDDVGEPIDLPVAERDA